MILCNASIVTIYHMTYIYFLLIYTHNLQMIIVLSSDKMFELKMHINSQNYYYYHHHLCHLHYYRQHQFHHIASNIHYVSIVTYFVQVICTFLIIILMMILMTIVIMMLSIAMDDDYDVLFFIIIGWLYSSLLCQ
jgi:hypothetical protein